VRLAAPRFPHGGGRSCSGAASRGQPSPTPVVGTSGAPGSRPNRMTRMDAADYDAWYRTPRGTWIGEVEFRLLQRMLHPVDGESLLDVGCGTGYFTRRFANAAELQVVGIDPNRAWLDFARSHRASDEAYCTGRAERLPFADRSFDCTVSVTALCFVDDPRAAVSEILRVTRKRFVIGLLNRRSLLFRDKGRGGGSGAYRGARWHTGSELRALSAGMPADRLTLRSGIFVPNGGMLARAIERLTPTGLLVGAFIVVAGDVLPMSDRGGRSGARR
jgi:SAM-dependent methyltransferase